MEGNTRITVLSVDDHPLLREGLVAIIENEDDMVVVAQASCGEDGIREYSSMRPDITLMDLRLPDMSGIDALVAIRQVDPSARIIMLTMSEGDAEIQRALKEGARGYLLKSSAPQYLVDAIRNVHAGLKCIPPDVAAQLAEHMSDDSLTPREIDVLRFIAEGFRNREIATRLFISEETVKVHIKHVMGKLGAADRTQAVTIAVRRGIIEL